MCTTFCPCGAKQKNFTEDQERKARATVEDGFAQTNALTQLECLPQRLEGTPLWTQRWSTIVTKGKRTLEGGRTKKEQELMQQEGT